MLKIRLSRVGRKHEPVYRLVLTESTNAAKSGKSLEVLGSYDSRRKDKAEFNAEKIKYWVSKGAQLSDTAHNLMVRKGIIEGAKRNVLPKGVIEKAKAPVPTPEVGTPTSEDSQNVGEEIVAEVPPTPEQAEVGLPPAVEAPAEAAPEVVAENTEDGKIEEAVS